MDHRLFAATLDPRIATVDLHEATTIHDALAQLEHELCIFSQAKKPYCRVIYGIGTGVLREEVLSVMRTHPLVAAWEEDAAHDSCFVIF